MSSATFVFDVLVTFFLAAILLWRYSDWYRQPILVTLSVLTAWYFSFLIIFIIPLDVSSTIYKMCRNDTGTSTAAPPITTTITTFDNETRHDNTSSHVDNVDNASSTVDASQCRPPHSLLSDSTLLSMWLVVYWTSQLLTWLVLPLMQSFTQAGEFTFLGRLKSSLWDNAIYYCSYLLIAVILLTYIALQPDLHLNFDSVKAIAASASNTWGLFILVLMLGYGLVEVPRQLWSSSNPGYRLNKAYFKVAKLWGEKSDAEGNLEEVLGSVEAVNRVVGQVDIAREHIDVIVNKVPLEIMERVRRRRLEADMGNATPDEKSLAKLNKQVMLALQTHRRTEAQWGQLMDQVYRLEDDSKNHISNEKVFRRQVTTAGPVPWWRLVYTPQAEWYLRCIVQPLLFKIVSVVAVVMSVFVIWSEATFFSNSPPLSLFALFISAAKSNHDYMAIEFISFCTICYLSICAYYTVFKVRVLNYYYLAPNHQSDEYTLLFSGLLLSRVTPPLCLNFLSIIHMDSHVISQTGDVETAYTRVMGHMDVVKIVSDYFNIYFPMLLLALTAATYFSLGSRLLSSLGFQQFLEQEEMAVEMVEEGKELVKREKRRRERQEESAGRRREWSERYRPGGEVTEGEPRQRSVAGGAQEGRTPEHLLATGRQVPDYSGRLDDIELVVADNTSSGRTAPPRNIFDDI